MSDSDVIVDYQTGVYVVTRQTPGALTNGIPAPPSTSTLNVPASVQPVSGTSLRDLPEGMSADESRVIFTTVPLLGVAEGVIPDFILIEGLSFRIKTVAFFGILGSHYRSYAEKVTVP